MKLPTQRSLESWRKEGWTCAKTEHWNSWAKVRQDLFGFVDVIAYRFSPEHPLPVKEIVALQCTTDTNHSARRKKILTDIKVSQYAFEWLKAGGKIYVCSWGKKGKEGKRKLWEERVEEITVEDFSPE